MGLARSARERGHLMVGLMSAIAVMLILSTVATQSWQDVLRRDKEAEMMFRAQEIVRALRRYQKDQGALPLELDKLLEPGSRGQYFLRRMYDDPLVKGGKWGLLYVAPGGGVLDPSQQALDPTAGAPPGLPSRPEGAFGGGGRLQRLGQEPGTRSRAAGQAGEMAGLPIAGVKSLCTDRPFRVFREQTEYSQWLFTVFDLDLLGQSRLPGQPPQRPGQPPGGQPPGQRPGQPPRSNPFTQPQTDTPQSDPGQ